MTVHCIKMAAAHDDTEVNDLPNISFSDFWAAYPRRVARKDAETAWRKIDAGEYHKIIDAVNRAKKTDDWRREAGKFIPYPASYLRGERWTDELEADLSMGQCMWNINGNRGPDPRCGDPASLEKNGAVYCKRHGVQI